MALISTDNLRDYALNPELLADKHPNTVDVINQLQSIVTALATLANELKADHNALLAKLDADAEVSDTNYAASHATSAADVTI